MKKKKKNAPATQGESYQGLARKWRPQTFGELVGQDAVAESLANALKAQRVAHGHVLAGPRGVGKTTSARILARALNCERGVTDEPCGKCRSCVDIAAGIDLDVIEIDAASNTKVEQMRELMERVILAPFAARFKVYIIDEVHMLSMAAFNALLKTLEEPPSNVVFVFATTELEKIPATVRSRCVIHNFRRLGVDDIIRRLGEVAKGEGIKLKESNAREIFGLIARSVDGGMRDALVTFDQLLAMTGGKPDTESAQRLLGLSSQATLADTIGWLAEGNARALIGLIDDLVGKGRSLERFVKGLMAYLHDVMLLQADPETTLISLSADALEQAERQSRELTRAQVFNMMNQLFELEERLKQSTQARFLVEFTFLRMAVIKPIVPIDEVMARLKSLPEGALAPSQARDKTAGNERGRAMNAAVVEGDERRTERNAAEAQAAYTPSPASATTGADAGRVEALALHDSGADATPSSQATRGSEGAVPEARALAGLARDELIDLIVPVLPEASQFLGRYLRAATAMRADQGTLWIQWPKDDRVGSRMIARAENKKALEQTLARLAGRPMVTRSSFSSEETVAPVRAPVERFTTHPSFNDVAVVETPAAETEPIEIVSPPLPPLENRTTAGQEELVRPAEDEDQQPAVIVSEARSRKLLEGNGEFARRARMVRQFFGGTFVDESGRPFNV